MVHAFGVAILSEYIIIAHESNVYILKTLNYLADFKWVASHQIWQMELNVAIFYRDQSRNQAGLPFQ